MTTNTLDVASVRAAHDTLGAHVGSVIVGQGEALSLAFITLLCGGHCLLEGVPGVGKTLLVRTLARALDMRFGRVQFTPDLLPSDIIGTPILDASSGDLRFRAGPIFTDLLLADEINRASAKTQAALLEAMQERHATVDGIPHELGSSFTVFATQNPVEHQGTYPLPEAELDRFLFKIRMGYPSESEESALLARPPAAPVQVEAGAPVLDRADLERARATVRDLVVQDDIVNYALRLIRATREDPTFALGASPRAGVMLMHAVRAQAALQGRDYAIPEDAQDMFFPVLRHRVRLDPGAEMDGLDADAALRRTLQSVPVPR